MSFPTQHSNAVLSPSEILSKRHLPNMLLLALGAGAVNAGAFAVCDRFVTHVTGTVSRIGIDAGQWLLMAEYSMVLLAFIAGAMASVLAIQARTLRGKRPLPEAPLFGAAAVLFGVALVGASGAFGVVGATSEEAVNFAFLSVLAFAMGLLNAGVSSSTALGVRPTHMTGPTTDFAVSLATALVSEGELRLQALRLAGLRGGKVLCFILGAAVMFPLVGAVGFLAFVAPALIVFFVTVRSFMPAREGSGLAPNARALAEPSR